MIGDGADSPPTGGTLAGTLSGMTAFTQTAAALLSKPLDDVIARGLADESIDRDFARRALTDSSIPLTALTHAAGQIRRRFFANRVQVHMLHNVQCGACPEDCGYCGQAKTSDAPIQAYKLKSRDEIIAEAERARANGAFRYCMVLSGRGPNDRDIDHMVECIREVKERFGLQTCLSAGLMDGAKAKRLKAAGLDRLNHNLNTSEQHYPSICTTHTYRDRVETLRSARTAGLSICSGLIVGMGESHDDLLDVAYELRELDSESIPVNFLMPIPGNDVIQPVCGGEPLTPTFCLRLLCVMRLINPKAEIRMAAGREIHLRSLQAMALEPANSLFIDGYLLTRGTDAIDTVRMIQDAGFELELAGGEASDELRKLIESIEPASTAPDTKVIKDAHISERKLAKLSVSAKQ